jgi:hypothetical protein
MSYLNNRSKDIVFFLSIFCLQLVYANNIDSLLKEANQFSRLGQVDSSIQIYNNLMSEKIYPYQKQTMLLNYLKDVKMSRLNTLKGDQLVLNLLESLISTGYPFTDFLYNLDYGFYNRNKVKIDVIKLKQDSIFIKKYSNLTNVSLSLQLKEMVDMDQKVRYEYDMYNDLKDSLKLIEADYLWNYVDFKNRNLLNLIIRDNGIPSTDMIGNFGQMWIKLLFLHQDNEEFLLTNLNVIYKANKDGVIQNIEHVIDKSMSFLTSKTIYGTGFGTEPRLTDTTEIRMRLRAINIDY